MGVLRYLINQTIEFVFNNMVDWQNYLHHQVNITMLMLLVLMEMVRQARQAMLFLIAQIQVTCLISQLER
jgi:hypothetical protein